MLLGYASGDSAAWQGVEPFAEVAGLSAELAGQLASFIQTLRRHWRQLCQPCKPGEWRQRVTGLLDDLALIEEEPDARLQTSVIEALEQWQTSCDEARFDEPVPVSVVRSLLLSALEQNSLSQRFLAGRINFCTLMPMRSIPFRVVCLLGMNDGDYPRTQMPMDFDLMAGRQQYRPGDRSRREDDRYLFLEALLSARDRLLISWVGRSIRDNASAPPSVLVAQLRDYLDQGWQHERGSTLDCLTTEHPLQPFSRQYFRTDGSLFTYASEWRDALEPVAGAARSPLPLPEDLSVSVSPAELARFLQDPVALFFNERLKVRALPGDAGALDDEPFVLDALTGASIHRALLEAGLRAVQAGQDIDAGIHAQAQRLCATGQLPPPPWDRLHADALVEDTRQLALAWQQALLAWPDQADAIELQITGLHPEVPFSVEGWLNGLHRNGERLCQLIPVSGEIQKAPWRLLSAWVQHLCGNAQGLSLDTWLINAETSCAFAAIDQDQALTLLGEIARAWIRALQVPLPLAPRTGFDSLSGKAPNLAKAESRYQGAYQHIGERDYQSNMLLARSFPSFAALIEETLDGQPLMTVWAEALYAPLLHALQPLSMESAA